MSEEIEWTITQILEIEKWLHRQWKDYEVCKQCGQHSVFVGQTPAHLVVGGPNGGMRLGESYPCISLVCSNCGNTQLINALVAGISFPKKGKEAGNA